MLSFEKEEVIPEVPTSSLLTLALAQMDFKTPQVSRALSEPEPEDWGPTAKVQSFLRKSSVVSLADGFRNLIVDEVLRDLLFIGGARIAAEEAMLGDLNVKLIVNATNLVMDHFPTRFRYFRVPVLDEEDEDMLSWLPECTNFIHQYIMKGQAVLVHCQAGVSRSSTVVCAYLIRHVGFSYEEAWNYLKQCRPCAFPNIGFQRQLWRWEQQVQAERSRPDNTRERGGGKRLVFDASP